MTQMHSQMESPYQEQSDVKLYQEPDRTSIMAILSMIFGIGGCCLGLTSIPAILLGIFSIFGISKSKGRVGGTGFGIAGILTGLLTLALWGGIGGAIVFGFNKFQSDYGQTTEQVFLDLQANNFDAVRASLASPAADVSDEELIAFRDGYLGGLGNLVSNTDGIGDFMSGYISIAQHLGPYSGKIGYTPVPMVFDSGYGTVLYVNDPFKPILSSTGTPMATGLIVIDSQGNEYHLPMQEDGDADSSEDEDQAEDQADEQADDSADSADSTDSPADDGTDGP
jgi:hypothetical protein